MMVMSTGTAMSIAMSMPMHHHRSLNDRLKAHYQAVFTVQTVAVRLRLDRRLTSIIEQLHLQYQLLK